MAGTTVRAAGAGDVPGVLELLYELGRPRPAAGEEGAFARMAESYASDPDKALLVAERGGELVGAASMLFLPRLNRAGPEAYVPELVVGGAHRGRGAGRALLEACAGLAAGRGCHRMRLESGNQREAAHRFYLAAGFGQTALSFSREVRPR